MYQVAVPHNGQCGGLDNYYFVMNIIKTLGSEVATSTALAHKTSQFKFVVDPKGCAFIFACLSSLHCHFADRPNAQTTVNWVQAQNTQEVWKSN